MDVGWKLGCTVKHGEDWRTMKHQDLSLRLLRRVAAAADADIRTTTKVALGFKVRGIVAERIAEELRRAGIEVPVVSSADQLEADQQQQARAAAGGGS